MHENRGSLGEGNCAVLLPALLAAVPLCLVAASVSAADNESQGVSEATFLFQIIALLACGRLLGELMQRIASRRSWAS